MQDIETKYGKLEGVTDVIYYKSKKLRSVRFDKLNKITILGVEFTPQYGDIDTRTKFREAISFYESGNIKSIYLNEIVKLNTNIGDIEAEFITFYETGEVHRVFPLYGQVSGYWSEDEEKKLAKKSTFDVGEIHVDSKINSYCFYKSGAVKSLTLWKDEIVMAKIYRKNIAVRLGIAFYETGELKSIEPYIPTMIKTSVGMIMAYDNQPIGIHGDNNSVGLDENGKVREITTVSTAIHIKDKEGNIETVSPKVIRSQIDIEQLAILPISIVFSEREMIIKQGVENRVFNLDDNLFTTEERMFENIGDPCSNCKGCHNTM